MNVRPVKPQKLPLKTMKTDRFTKRLEEASTVLARFEELTSKVKNPTKTFAFLIQEEARISLHFQKNSVSTKDYERLLKWSMKEIEKRPLSTDFFKEMHQILRKGDKAFRTKQNWIGPKGCTLVEAYFIPPKPQHISASMKNLICYMNSYQQDPLTQLAISFAQFLIIHPFMDGNGRIARLLIPLFLKQKGILSHPIFFMSDFFKKERVNYFRKLYAISENKNWEGWIVFFLEAMIKQGKTLARKIKRSGSLHS
jgi:Fic family protein